MSKNGIATFPTRERDVTPDEPAQEQQTRPERIDAGDLGHHAYILRQDGRLAALEQQRRAIEQEMAIIRGATASWTAYLTEAYALPDGTAIRADGAFSYPEARG